MSDNWVENLFSKGDDDTARNGEKSVCSLGRVVAFERQADLHNTEAEQDQTDCPDQAKHKVGQIVHDLQRITARRERGHRHGKQERHHQHGGTVDGKAFLSFSLNT